MIGKILKKIWFTSILLLRGKLQYATALGVKIGNNCRIYTTNWGSEPFLIEIGNNVTITASAKFITHDGSGWLMRDEKGRRFFYGRILIGDDVFVGLDAIIMPGIKIGNQVVIAAGSVVTKSVPPGSVVAGVPAKIVGSFGALQKKMLETYVSENEIDRSKPFKEWVLDATVSEFKPNMKL